MAYDSKNLLWENRNFRTKTSVIGQVVYQPGGTCGPRIQRNYQLIIIHSGSGSCRINSHRHELKVDHISFLSPNRRIFFSFSKKTKTHHSWCSIARSAMPEDFKKKLRKHVFNVPCSDTFKRLLSFAFQMESPLSAAAEKVIDFISLSVFAEFLNSTDDKESPSAYSTCINKAVRHMENHFHEDDCLVKTHSSAGASRCTLISRFKEELKITPDKFLWRLRAEHGIAMLIETGLTVAEIAYRCGFKNPFHFSRVVKTMQGSSPRKIRYRAWSGKR